VSVIALADFTNGSDVWMIKSGGRLCFTYKPIHPIFIFGKLWRQNFARIPTQAGIFSQTDLAHVTSADLADDRVMSKRNTWGNRFAPDVMSTW